MAELGQLPVIVIRTAEELLAKDFRVVIVDLAEIGTRVEPETWYGDVLEVVADQLGLATKAPLRVPSITH